MEYELRDVKEHLHDELIEDGTVELVSFAQESDLGLEGVVTAAEHLCRYGNHTLDLTNLVLRVETVDLAPPWATVAGGG